MDTSQKVCIPLDLGCEAVVSMCTSLQHDYVAI